VIAFEVEFLAPKERCGGDGGHDIRTGRTVTQSIEYPLGATSRARTAKTSQPKVEQSLSLG
jgi:hypothetical protein